MKRLVRHLVLVGVGLGLLATGLVMGFGYSVTRALPDPSGRGTVGSPYTSYPLGFLNPKMDVCLTVDQPTVWYLIREDAFNDWQSRGGAPGPWSNVTLWILQSPRFIYPDRAVCATPSSTSVYYLLLFSQSMKFGYGFFVFVREYPFRGLWELTFGSGLSVLLGYIAVVLTKGGTVRKGRKILGNRRQQHRQHQHWLAETHLLQLLL